MLLTTSFIRKFPIKILLTLSNWLHIKIKKYKGFFAIIFFFMFQCQTIYILWPLKLKASPVMKKKRRILRFYGLSHKLLLSRVSLVKSNYLCRAGQPISNIWLQQEPNMYFFDFLNLYPKPLFLQNRIRTINILSKILSNFLSEIS